MKKLLPIIIMLLFFNISFAQKSEKELLSKYNSYIESNVEKEKWKTKYYLSNGLITIQENYYRSELRSRIEFEYDEFGNIERKINNYNINKENENNVSNIKLVYKDSLLIRREYSFGKTEKYSDFNEFGKPKLIETEELVLLKPFTRELLVYDTLGNIIKSTTSSDYQNSDISPKPENEKSITNYKYDEHNNVIEIHRAFEPKQEFPIQITGGPLLYEYEYFRYEYNKKGLWTKKYKTVNGEEYLVTKRRYN